MALRVLSITSFTPTATADAPTVLADGSYLAVQGASATQRIRIEDIYMGGQAGASAPTLMMLARDSVIGATTSISASVNDAALSAATAALAAAPVTFNQATTKPQRSTSAHLLPLNFNAFGGLIRLNLSPNERELDLIGNANTTGEISFSAFSGGTPGAMGGYIVYEPF